MSSELAPKVVETHTSLLFFVGDRVYKMKKSVDLGFLDFRKPAARAHACEEEVLLNRRLAPDVYPGVAELRGPDGSVCEHLVVMRRMPDDRRLSRLLRSGPSVTSELRRLARLIASFHETCAQRPDITALGSRGAVQQLWSAGFRELRAAVRGLVRPDHIDECERLALRYLVGREPLFTARQVAGRVRDGHGDLLADDIFCLPDGPRVLDCLEFDPRLRAGDVLLDVAFLAMDLERLGHPDAAREFLDAYRQFSAETHPSSLEDHYVAYRALVRAKVAALRYGQGEPAAAEQARDLAALCRRHLERSRIRLVLVGGLPGSGKTTLASRLAYETGWPVLGSDVIRKELFGLSPQTSAASPYGQGIYSPDHTAHTYQELLRRAGQSLGYGESVILDATWNDAQLRGRARALAEQTASDIVELRCELPDQLAEDRLRARSGAHREGSDADASIRRRLSADANPWPEAVRLCTNGSSEATLREARLAVDAVPPPPGRSTNGD